MSLDIHHNSDDQTGAIPDLLHPEVLDAFDRETFERDGYWVWEGVVTDAGCKQWKANLKKLQQMNDAHSHGYRLGCHRFRGTRTGAASARTDCTSIFGIMLRRIGTDAAFSKI